MATRVFDQRTPAPEVMNTRRAWRVGDHFEVVSRSAKERYRVDVEGRTCTCTAGTGGNGLFAPREKCVHRQIVRRRLERELRPPCRVCGNWPCTCNPFEGL